MIAVTDAWLNGGDRGWHAGSHQAFIGTEAGFLHLRTCLNRQYDILTLNEHLHPMIRRKRLK